MGEWDWLIKTLLTIAFMAYLYFGWVTVVMFCEKVLKPEKKIWKFKTYTVIWIVEVVSCITVGILL